MRGTVAELEASSLGPTSLSYQHLEAPVTMRHYSSCRARLPIVTAPRGGVQLQLAERYASSYIRGRRLIPDGKRRITRGHLVYIQMFEGREKDRVVPCGKYETPYYPIWGC